MHALGIQKVFINEAVLDLSERCERRGVRTCMQDQCVYICIFQSFILSLVS